MKAPGDRSKATRLGFATNVARSTLPQRISGILLLALLAVAGCSSALGGGTGTSEQSDSVTSKLAIDCGSTGAVGSFSADQGYNGGTTTTTSKSVATSGVANAAPEAVYQSVRYGDFTYAFGSLTPGAAYTVRLHFAETYWTATSKRVFNVLLNDKVVLSAFDIYANAGALKAVVKTFSVVADPYGKVLIYFESLVDNAMVNGIEVSANTTSHPDGGTSDGGVADTSRDSGSHDSGSSADRGPVSDAGLFLGLSFQGLTLDDYSSTYTVGTATSGSGWSTFTGTDGVYELGNPRAPASIWGGTATYTDGIQLIQDAKTNYTRAIVTDTTVPTGVSDRVLQISMNVAYDPNVGGISGDTMQDSFVIHPSTTQPQGMVYFSKWVWLQGDMASRAPFEWFLNDETKTDITERFGSGIEAMSWTGFGSDTPVWYLTHDAWPTDSSPSYQVYAETFLSPSSAAGAMRTGQTYYAPVPLGQWFRVENAWNRSPGGTGWIWMALTVPGSSDPMLRTGIQVFAQSGPMNLNYNGSDPETIGWNAYNSDAINRVFPFGAYSDIARSASSPFAEKVTNVEVWNTWPATATAHPATFR
jgi:hypothetical protein